MKKQRTRYRKIRGINRRKRAISQWGERNKVLDIEALKEAHRDYVKFRVRPWSGFSFINSVYPEPTGDCEYLLIKNLQKIYQSWKGSLDALKIPYYLQIWLFENYISRSQVVCAIDNYKDFYRNTFELVEKQPSNSIKSSIHYNSTTAEYLDRFTWRLYRSLVTYDLTDELDKTQVQQIETKKLLRKEIIWGNEHQVVEDDQVWLIL